MDDISSLAETSQKFASFLTVARKFEYNRANIFHTMQPEKSVWKSQTSILNTFSCLSFFNKFSKNIPS